MSILGDIGKGIKNIVKGGAKTFKQNAAGIAGATLGGMVGGPAGAMIGSSIGSSLPSLPSLPGIGGGGMGTVIGGVVGGLGGAGRAISSVAKGAASMCAKYPQWCLGIGGVAAVANLMHSGQLPVPKRRRRRGITPRDLQSFRRVAGLIKTYSTTAHRVPSRCAPKRKC